MYEILTQICVYGEASLAERILSDCACRDCQYEWIALTPYDMDTSLLECPQCGSDFCDAEIKISNED